MYRNPQVEKTTEGTAQAIFLGDNQVNQFTAHTCLKTHFKVYLPIKNISQGFVKVTRLNMIEANEVFQSPKVGLEKRFHYCDFKSSSL